MTTLRTPRPAASSTRSSTALRQATSSTGSGGVVSSTTIPPVSPFTQMPLV
jgi:hypothetical protein